VNSRRSGPVGFCEIVVQVALQLDHAAFDPLKATKQALSHQPFLLVSTYPLAEVGFNRVNGLANQSKRV
jgi:hypothetical protein